MQSINWQDLRYLMEIVRGGTLTAAARKLGVNQTTVSRRNAVDSKLHAEYFARGMWMPPAKRLRTGNKPNKG